MSSITPVYIAKHLSDILDLGDTFYKVQESLIDNIVDNDLIKEDIINNEYDMYYIGNYSYDPYEIASQMDIVEELMFDIISDNVRNMYEPTVGDVSVIEMDIDYSISCGLRIVDDSGVRHVIDDEGLYTLTYEPTLFTATDGTEWNLAFIDGEYVIVPDEPEKECYIYIVRIQATGVPIVAGCEDCDTDRQRFEDRLVELSSINAMLLNVYEDDKRVLATVYL